MSRSPALLFALVVVAAAIVALHDPGKAFAATTLEAEAMQLPVGAGRVLDDTAATSGRALEIWSDAGATGRVTLPLRTERVVVRARAEACAGDPVLAISVDGAEVMRTAVTSAGYADYGANVPVSAGAHTVTVAFVNDYLSLGCDRNVIVDGITLVEPTFELEAESMRLDGGGGRVLTGGPASGGQALEIWSDDTARRAVTLAPTHTIVVRARGEQCEGAPTMAVQVDGNDVLTAAVDSTSWRDYRASVDLPGGLHTVAIRFTNDHLTTGCDRNLFVDEVSFDRLFDADFADMGLSEYAAVIHPERISVVDDPILGAARKVVKLTVYDQDTGPTGNPRAQLETPPLLHDGDDVWIGWSTLFPQDFPTSLPAGGWLTFEEVYGPPFAGPPPRELTLSDDVPAQIAWTRNATYDFDRPFQTPLVTGRWIDFVVHERLSADPSVGFVEIYMNSGDGWQQQPLAGRPRLYMSTIDASDDSGPSSDRLTLYRKQGMFDVLTIYDAAHRIGTSFEAVDPRTYG